MTITDLPSTVPNPPGLTGDGASDAVLPNEAGSPPVVDVSGERSFSLEMPDEAPVVIEAFSEGSASPDAQAAPHATAGDEFEAVLSRAAVRPRPPLPSYAVVLIGGLALACLALCVALVAALSRPEPVGLPTPPPAPSVRASPEAEDAPIAAADPASEAPSATPADFPAPPVPIPVDLLTVLEAASSEPLDVELNRLLDAINHGFGTQSARLDPTLRSYVYRMAARFEWNPNTFRVAVTAPDARLAEARKALLESLFEEAVASGRLDLGTGTGPHALTLVTS